MTNLASEDPVAALHNPLDLLEQLVAEQDWVYDRTSEDEVSAVVPGSWCEYQLRFFWREEETVLQVACAFDMRVPEAKRSAIYETLALVNERMWMGHFELWSEDGTVLFRHATFLDEDVSGMSLNHAELLIQCAISECERLYPVFQFVLWAGKKPQEALEAALLETVGEA